MINSGKRLVIGASKVVNIEAAKNSNEYPIWFECTSSGNR